MSIQSNCGCAGVPPGSRTDRQYSAKLVCGLLAPPSPKGRPGPLAPGQYYTAVNVHNPSRCDAVTLRWKVAVASPVNNERHIVSGFADARLGPDEALEIDCADAMELLKHTTKPPPFVKGWVVVETEGELDVVAVYTASPKAGAPAESFHTERVPARCVARCEDFGFDLSTGTAAWQVQVAGSASGLVSPALGKMSTSWSDLPGALWLNPSSLAAANTSFTYQLCFDLCSGFHNPVLHLSLLADNEARVELNGNVLNGPNYNASTHPWHTASGTNAFKKVATASATAKMFRVGRNCLTVTVRNQANPSGLAIHGFLDVDAGQCPGRPGPRIPCPSLNYRAHVADFLFEDDHGWLDWVSTGQTSGTTGQNRRLEAFEIVLVGAPPGTSIRYRGHLKNSGWTGWASDGQTCGTTGQGRRMEAVEIEMLNRPLHCRLRYRVHMRGLGWGPWVNEGQQAGTTGQNRRIEAIEVVID